MDQAKAAAVRGAKWGVCAGALAIVAAAVAGVATAQDPMPQRNASSRLTRVDEAACEPGSTSASRQRDATHQGDPQARRAAQRALAFLGREVGRWQEQHQCYGCHVQAVSLEALVVGRANGYQVPERDMRTVLEGMLTLPGGARANGGLSYHVTGLLEPSNAFGGVAFAHYDEHVDQRLSDDLLRVAARLEEMQTASGAIQGDYTNGPVAQGPIQTTMQAVATWRQAYARSADERWLRPIRKAEDFLTSAARQLASTPNANVQHINYAMLGLLAAGARESEATLQQLASALRERQARDGSWGGALETGQTLYTLRKMGASDDDPVVRRGTAWLVRAQQDDGGWGLGGASRGTAMWAMLGLVSIDVASIAIGGVEDGQHVSGAVSLESVATDNENGRIVRTDVFVDDVRVASVCGPRATHRLDASQLEAGRHIIRVVATNAAGRTGRKHVELYTGDYYLTDHGTRWVDGATVLSFRDVAPAALGHRVVMEIHATREQNGQHVRGQRVHRAEQRGAQGAIQMRWDGRGERGELPRGRYVAQLSFVDEQGRTRQSVEIPFVHDSPEARHAAFGQVAGTLTLAEGGGAAANAEVELLDARGQVVARTRTTHSGRYRFQDVPGGGYRVRVRREGFRAVDAPVRAAPAAEAAADLELH